MFFLKSIIKTISRQLERNQVASRAILGFYDKPSISDIDDFNKHLWAAIANSEPSPFSLEIHNDKNISLEFFIKLLIKIGFNAEDAVRLLMRFHNDGSLILANAEEDTLLRLQEYINTQARKNNCNLANKIITHEQA